MCPFDAKATKPLTSPQLTASEEEHSSSDTATQETGDKLNESVCSSSGISLENSNISFIEDQVSLFQQRYDNGYNLYHDKMYVSQLQQKHSECLPNDLITSTSPGTYSSNTEFSGISPLGVQAPTQSLSVSLSQTRGLLSELSVSLNQPKASVKAKGKQVDVIIPYSGKFRGQKFLRLTSLKNSLRIKFRGLTRQSLHLYAIIRFSRINFRGS